MIDAFRKSAVAKLLVAMVVGGLVGTFAPGCVIRALNSFAGTFSQFVKFIVPFIINGAAGIFISTSQANYFTVTAPPHLVVSGTILILLTNGALAGILGMMLNPLLHNIIWAMPETSPMTHYRVFLSVGAVIFLIGVPAILLLPKDSPSKTDNATEHEKQFS